MPDHVNAWSYLSMPDHGRPCPIMSTPVFSRWCLLTRRDPIACACLCPLLQIFDLAFHPTQQLMASACITGEVFLYGPFATAVVAGLYNARTDFQHALADLHTYTHAHVRFATGQCRCAGVFRHGSCTAWLSNPRAHTQVRAYRATDR